MEKSRKTLHLPEKSAILSVKKGEDDKMHSFLRALAVSATESSEQIESSVESGGTHPVFWVIAGVAAIGLIIMVIQNFVIKREEYYK